MTQETLRDKWDRLHADAPDAEPTPPLALAENAHLLPAAGTALDLACGAGGAALFLARRGLDVTAWDISPIAVARLRERAARAGLAIQAETRDAETEAFPRAAFDAIVVSRFLARPLAAPIVDSLKPGGLLFYQTFVRDKLSSQGPSNPDYLLAPNELLRLFGDLRTVFYREDSRYGDLSLGRRDEAFFVGAKASRAE
jgi:SAM-dependent methyltransferase